MGRDKNQTLRQVDNLLNLLSPITSYYSLSIGEIRHGCSGTDEGSEWKAEDEIISWTLERNLHRDNDLLDLKKT